jgi:hypothetical protein
MLSQLDEPCRVCSSAIVDGMSVLQAAVGKCYGIKLPNAHKTIRIDDPLVARAAIISARTELKAKLDSVVHETNKARPVRRTEKQHAELFQKSLHSTSLLHVGSTCVPLDPKLTFAQISSELVRALTLAHGILVLHHTTARPQVFFLRPSWLWLGMSPRALIAEEDTSAPAAGTDPDPDTLSQTEARSVLLPNPSTATLPRPRWGLTRMMRTPGALRARIRLSNMLWRARHSTHVQHAFKNALGIGLLMLPAVLPASSDGESGPTCFSWADGWW